MPVVWNGLTVPGPPAGFELTAEERGAGPPLMRFRRRLIALLDCAAHNGDRLALVDKAIPHTLFDLMLSEASELDKPSPDDVAPVTGRVLWGTGLDFVRYVSRPDVMTRFGLEGGTLHLALNCDPNTRDRESVQAAKQFHLHLLYWTLAELAPLSTVARIRGGKGIAAHPGDFDARTRRQLLDPLTFAGARALTTLLADMELGVDGAALEPIDDAAVAAGRRPLGAVIQLPGWRVLGDAAFEDLIRRLHQRLAAFSAALMLACTGRAEPPPPWRRHPLLPGLQRRSALKDLGLREPERGELTKLLMQLRDLSAPLGGRLRRGSPALRRHLMTLAPPSYSLNLHAPVSNRPDAPLLDAAPVYLSIQPKLFSGIGGAGLLWLGGVPSVRIRRGVGRFTLDDWRRRAEFQRGFALDALTRPSARSGVGSGRVRRFVDCQHGWV